MAKQKYYAVRQGRKPGIYTTWDECKAQVDGIASIYKSFPTLEEAEAFMNSDAIPLGAKKAMKSAQNKSSASRDEVLSSIYLGSDEVGKGEPFSMLFAVACYATEEGIAYLRELGADKDSKKFANVDAKEVAEAGQLITGFSSIEEVENKVYANRKKGIFYSVYGLSNTEYNKIHSAGINANQILSIAHNRAQKALYLFLAKENIGAKYFVIDNFMGEYDYLFNTRYLLGEEEPITKIAGTEVVLEAKAESKYPLVAAASVIGSYIEQLYHTSVRDRLEADGVNSDIFRFGNTTSEINACFKEIEKSYGRLDNSPVDFKKTEHYKRYIAK